MFNGLLKLDFEWNSSIFNDPREICSSF